MKKYTILFTVAIFVILTSLLSCEKTADNGEVHNSVRDVSVNLKEASVSTIDSSLYTFHAYDYYSDKFFFNQSIPNRIETSSDYIAYKGMWACRFGDFPIRLIYNQKTKTLSITLDYRHELVMQYQMELYSNNRFEGSWIWHKYYPEKNTFNHRMNFVFTKGSLPGMNTAAMNTKSISLEELPQSEFPREYND